MSIDESRSGFWVRPFEFRGDGSDGRPHALVKTRLIFPAQQWELKQIAGRIFGRQQGQGKETPIFMALEFPVHLSIREWERHWEAAWERGLVTRLIPLPNALPNQRGDIALLRLREDPGSYLLKVDGTIFLLSTNGEYRLYKRCLPLSLEAILSGNWGREIYEAINRFPEPKQREFLHNPPYANVPLKWLAGSKGELQEVSKAFFHWVWPSVNEEGNNLKSLRCIVLAANCSHPFHLNLELNPYGFGNFWDATGTNWQERLRYIQSHFYCAGQESIPATDMGYGTRCERIETRTLSWVVRAPSFHERIEASAVLRDWLRDKLAPDELDKWFSSTV